MKKASPASPKKTAKSPGDYMEIRVPKLSFQNTTANGYLVFTLVIFSFLLGMLTNKVLYLDKLAKTGELTAAQPNNTVPSPVEPPAFVAVENGKLPVLGNKDAKVTIVEFSDFQCPFCERYFTDTSQKVYDTYIKTGKAKLYYRHFPLKEIHPNAQLAAEASECANEQGQFWNYHNMLFQNQATWSNLADTDVTDSFVDLATQVGLDTTQFRSCLDNHKYTKAVDDDSAAGSEAQVDGTPTFFINGNRLVGAVPFSEFQQLIDEELKK